jgi:ABC-type Fe3+-hydroxamate transport system substrate-binding protein
VLYWADPHTAGGGTMIGHLIEAAGGTNAARESGVVGIVPLGAERAFALDPDVVLVARWQDAASALRAHPLLRQMRAVRAGRIVEMPNRLLVTLSHHAVDGAWWLAHAFHPDRIPRETP